MTLVNVSKRSATLLNLSLAFIFLLKLFRGQIYSVPKFQIILIKFNTLRHNDTTLKLTSHGVSYKC